MIDEIYGSVPSGYTTNLSTLASYLKDGLIMEFGVHTGGTLNIIANANKDRPVYGFDSFEGLPEAWHGMAVGTFACPVPVVPDNVTLVKGWFNETIPPFIKENIDPVAFIHFDADLYSSTKCIFDNFKDRFQDGTVIAFDELIDYGDQLWREHEIKAFAEFLEETKYSWECIGRYGSHQVGFVIHT